MITAMFRAISISLLCLSASCTPPVRTGDVRFATWNLAMGLDSEGELATRLSAGDDAALRSAAEVLQRVRPDVVLLNEFDFQAKPDLAALLISNYLAVPQGGQAAIDYPHVFRAPVNTGVPSGLDQNDDGASDGPADAWGFGHFPGQFGMLVLSRLPITAARTFRHFRWQDLPGALRPVREDGSDYYPDSTWEQLRLSSKSHWDLSLRLPDGRDVHLLASHPTPPSFDGPEDRNGRRNHDEIRFWIEYVDAESRAWIIDDDGRRGGLPADAQFVIAGDLNADRHDGNSLPGSIDRLLDHPRVNNSCTPASAGGAAAAARQGQANDTQRGDPSHDTADFSDGRVGNLRADYAIPSAGLEVSACGVFWPLPETDEAGLIEFTDHRLVWVDIALAQEPE